MILTDYLINGQDLTGEHSGLIVGTTHFTSISPRINSVTVNGRNGVMLPAGPVAFDAPEITLKFIANGPDADVLMHRFEPDACGTRHGIRLDAAYDREGRVHVLPAGRRRNPVG